MKVIVTGGAGYIGSHICVALCRIGYQPVIMDNFINSSAVCIDRVRQLTGNSVNSFEVDVCNFSDVLRVFEQERPSAIIHCAGLKAVGESSLLPLHYYEKNILGALNVLKAMDCTETKRIIFSSSATVYGAPVYLPFDELHPLSPESPYGRTKLLIEHMIQDWAATGEARSAVLLRYFNPIGADASGMIGEDPNGKPDNLMPFILEVASGKRSLVRVFGDDYETHDGTGVRDYVHVDDLAAAHCASLDYTRLNFGVEVFNVGTGQGYSVLELLKALEQASNKTVKYSIVDRRSGDIAKSFADNTKAATHLGWVPKYDLARMCGDAWNWRVKNPEGYTR